MKANQIQVGHHYLAKVSNRVVPIRVTRAGERNNRPAWYCTNVLTGREVMVRSVQRFRCECDVGGHPIATVPEHKAALDVLRKLAARYLAMPNGGAALTVSKEGVVGDGMRAITRFADQATGFAALESLGFTRGDYGYKLNRGTPQDEIEQDAGVSVAVIALT